MNRAIEICIAAIILLLLSPLLAVIGLIIRFDSKGPALFFQSRVGQFGNIFKCLKLRTMKVNTEDMPSHCIDEKQVTRVGRFLRKTKVDELPQLWNVIRGEMSFVGPRPSLPSQTQLIEERKARGVFDVLPGITGLAQIRQIDMSDPARLAAADAEYLDKKSFIQDVRIIFGTVFGGLFKV